MIRPARAVLILLFLLTAACAPELPNPAAVLQAVTAVPTLDIHDAQALCTAVNIHWGRDWETSIRALEALRNLSTICEDGLAIDNRLYTAYLAYGTVLEQRGRTNEALEAYTTALGYNRLGTDAARRLERLGIATPLPPERCEPETVMQAVQALPPYMPTEGSFVQVEGRGFVLDGEPYIVHGVNYYPRSTPFWRFLTETPLEVVQAELDVIKRGALNTLRIFLRHDDLFICPGSGAVPIAENFLRLDGIIQAAAEKGFRLIVTLNHEADLEHYPLYTSPQHTMDQMRFILARYRDEPAVLAWDLRDRGDLDYREGRFSREVVLTWLFQSVATLRAEAPHQLFTAGWWEDAATTAPLVDFVSFQHYGDYGPLRQQVALLRSETGKPVLLTAIGYSTFALDETAQRNLLFQAFEEISSNDFAGWLVYMAFDYPLSVTCHEPDCPGQPQELNYYGIWNTSYFPKLALDAIRRVTIGPEPEEE